jgi:hypothetical protein
MTPARSLRTHFFPDGSIPADIGDIEAVESQLTPFEPLVMAGEAGPIDEGALGIRRGRQPGDGLRMRRRD